MQNQAKDLGAGGLVWVVLELGKRKLPLSAQMAANTTHLISQKMFLRVRKSFSLITDFNLYGQLVAATRCTPVPRCFLLSITTSNREIYYKMKYQSGHIWKTSLMCLIFRLIPS